MAEVEAFVNTAMVAVEQVGKDNTTGKNGVSKLFLAMIRESMTQVAKFKQDEVKKLQDQVVGQGVKISELTKDKDKLIKDNEDKDKLILDLQNDKVELQNQTDASNQYVRRDNFKITGVPYREGESTEDLIKVVQSVTKHIGREIAENEISDIHRLPNNQTDTNGSSAPGIIIRTNRRRVKHEIIYKKNTCVHHHIETILMLGSMKILPHCAVVYFMHLGIRRTKMETKPINSRGVKKAEFSVGQSNKLEIQVQAINYLNQVL